MILITGAAGFIGSNLYRELSFKYPNKNFIIVDRMKSQNKWKNIIGLDLDHFIHADDLFSEENEIYLSQVTMIFHMGASSSTTILDMDYLMKNNFEYSQKLFKLATRREIPFIYASSAATYGNGENGYDDNENEVNKLVPLNPYGFSKQLFDSWVLKQDRRPPIWYGLKFFNVYGPNEAHKQEMQSLVRKAYYQIKENGLVKLFKSYKSDFADGEQLRDFVYVKDLVKAMILLINNDKNSGILNMGTGSARSFKDLSLAVFKSMKVAPKIEYIEMPENIKNQYQYYTKANMNKFLSIYSDFKFTTLEEGISDYVINYLERDTYV